MKVTAKIRGRVFSNVTLNGKRCVPVRTCYTSRQVFFCGDYVLKLDCPYNEFAQNEHEIDGYKDIPNVFKHLIPKMIDHGNIEITNFDSVQLPSDSDMLSKDDINDVFIVTQRIRKAKNVSHYGNLFDSDVDSLPISNLKKKYIKRIIAKYEFNYHSYTDFFEDYVKEIADEYPDSSYFARNYLTSDLHDDNLVVTDDKMYLIDIGA